MLLCRELVVDMEGDPSCTAGAAVLLKGTADLHPEAQSQLGSHLNIGNNHSKSTGDNAGTQMEPEQVLLSADGHSGKQSKHMGAATCELGSADYSNRHRTSLDVPRMNVTSAAELAWYKNRLVVICLIGAGLNTVTFNYLDELTPLFASAPTLRGGLGMPESQFAIPLTVSGVALMLYSVLLYPATQKRFGQLTCCKLGLLGAIPSSMLVPASSAFLPSQPLVQSCLVLALCIRSVAKIMSLSSSTILINTVAPMSQIGAVNGASQTLAALARAAGPAIGGNVWATFSKLTTAGVQYLPFAAIVVGIAATELLYAFVKLK